MTKHLSAGASRTALALIGLVTLGIGVTRAREEGLPVGSKPPSFTVKTLKGVTLDPTKQQGKVVVLDFWATWCPPCRMSIPVLQAMHRKYASRGLTVIGISNEKRDQVTPFVARNKMTYTVAADPSFSSAEARYKVEGIPTLVVIDKKGVIQMYETGFNPGSSGAKLEEKIKKLLVE